MLTNNFLAPSYEDINEYNYPMSSKNLIRNFFKYLKPYLGKEFFVLFLLLIGSLGSLVTPYVLKVIIDEIFPNGNYRDLLFVLSILVGVYIIRILISVLTDVLYTNVSRSIVSDIRESMIISLLNRPISYFKQANSGEIMLKLTNDVENIQTALSSLILNFLSNSLTIIGIIIMLGILDYKLMLISLIILPIIIISIKKFTPFLQQNFDKIQKTQGVLNNFLLEKIRNIRVIKSYGSIEFELSKLIKIQNKIIYLFTKNSKLNSVNKNITTLMVAIGPVIVLAYGGRDVFTGAMTLGSLIAFMQYLNKLFTPTINVMNSYSQFNNALVSMRRVHDFLQPIPKEINLSIVKDNIEISSLDIKNISLSMNNHLILDRLSVTFKPGVIYGIIGESGSGKSSLFNVLCGFLIPLKGKVLINNKYSINDIKDWSRYFGLIEKENQLFNESILYNVDYGTFKSDFHEVLTSVKLAEFDEVLNMLENGLRTEVNETGTMLSDGQKQRIAIARALLKKPKILLFDEATSALDSKLESTIIDNIRKNFKNSIVLIITHKISSIDKFDIVYELENKTLNLYKKDTQLIT